MLEHAAAEATQLLDHWLCSEAWIFQRLAIHGLTRDAQRNDTEVLTLVRERHWLFAWPVKHELFQLLAARFPSADVSQQQLLVDSVLSEPVLNAEEPEKRRISDYERYNLLYWLATKAPESVAPAAFRSFSALHPDFAPRDHPDLDHWISVGSVEESSPWSAAELLHQPLTAERVSELINYQPTEDIGRRTLTRRGLDIEIETAAAQSFNWSQELARSLEHMEQWTSSLWGAISNAWKSTATALTPEQRATVIGFVERGRLPEQTLNNDLPDLLEALVDERTAETDLDRLDAIGDRALAISESEPIEGDVDDWLFRAINRRAGKVGQLWLQTLNQRFRRAEDPPTSIGSVTANRFEAAISATNLNGQLVRTILASRLDFLFSIDRAWTSEKLIPLFDWAQPQRATGVWQGFLTWGRWNPALFDQMLPHTIRAFAYLESSLKKQMDSFSGRLASIAAHLPGDPWHDTAWLFDFVKTADDDARSHWASHFGSYLEGLSDDRVAAIWTSWLRGYWTDRTTGVPLPLESKERRGMMMWLVPLRPHFDQALPLIAQTAPEKIDHYTFFKIDRSDLPDQHPVELGRLMVTLLAAAKEAGDGCEEIAAVAIRATTAGALTSDVVAIAEHLGRLGCEDSAKRVRAALAQRSHGA